MTEQPVVIDWDDVQARYAGHGGSLECRQVKTYLLCAIGEIKRYRRSIVAHHNIANLSDEAAKHWGDPDGCPICREAHQ